MTGRATRQSRQRPPNCRLSRRDGRSQGRRKPTRAARAPLTACRRGGYPISRLVLIQPATRVRFDRGNSSFNIRLAYYAGFESPCRGGAFIASKNLLTSA